MSTLPNATLTEVLTSSMVDGRKIVTKITDADTLYLVRENDKRAGIQAAVESRLRALSLPAERPKVEAPKPVRTPKPKAAAEPKPRPSRAKPNSTVKPKPARTPSASKGTVYPHACPCGCGRVAANEAEGERLFGFRNMKRYVKLKGETVVERRIQSFSKKCRGTTSTPAPTTSK